jgi:ABC-2 type transport system permease protein
MLKTFHYYFNIWLRLTLSSFQTAFISGIGAAFFLLGKFLRFGFLLLLTFLIVDRTKSLAGYSLNQVLIFYMTYNVIDTLTQLLFREVYRFRPKVVSGDFDLDLVKPANSLFRALLGGADPLDIIILIPYLIILTIVLQQTQYTVLEFISYIWLIINGFLIAMAFHIMVLALGIITTEIDHAMMIYRDLTTLGRFPIDIYHEPLRSVVTFIIPIGIMMSFPPKALFGLLSPIWVLVATLLAAIFIYISLWFWRYALTQYTSASS